MSRAGKDYLLDTYDISILLLLYNVNEWKSVSDIARVIFNLKDNEKPTQNHKSFIRSRLNKLVKIDLVKRKTVLSNIKLFKINKRKVLYGNAVLEIFINNHSKKIKFGDVIALKYEGSWYVKSIQYFM